MAITPKDINHSIEDRIVILQENLSSTNKKYSDLLKEKFGLDNNNVLNISLTREELANIVGTATESVIRLLSEFKDDHYVELSGRKIKILDIQGLTKTANI